MKFIKNASVNGTSLQGYTNTTYDKLVKVFGEPDFGPEDEKYGKVTCEWRLEFLDGTVATIYDWKTYDGTPMGEYDWHIGGRSNLAVAHVTDFLRKHKDIV